jgi:adenylylsulfate kinase-like enzyme
MPLAPGGVAEGKGTKSRRAKHITERNGAAAPGLPKTTLAYALESALFDQGFAAMVLDGETMRAGISKDLGFAPDDRLENLRRAAEVCRLMCDQGLIAIAAFVSPLMEHRELARRVIGAERPGTGSRP